LSVATGARPARRDVGDRHLEHERHHVDAVGRGRAADAEQVEHVEVDEERLVARAGERGHAPHGPDRLQRDRLVARERAVADVPRRDRDVVHDRLRRAGPLVDLLELVGLGDVEVRAGERIDRAGVVEERRAVLALRVERPAIGDIGDRVTVIVNVHFVACIVRELVEVRTRGREQQRHVVRDDDEPVRIGRAEEGVDVGIVGVLILGDRRRLAVRRRLCGEPAAEHEAGERE